MNHAPAIQLVSANRTVGASTVARFQIYQQTRDGVYASAFKTESAVEAIRGFLRQAPAFEGGEIRLWDHREQHLSAWVKWNLEGASLGVPAYERENVFQDRMLAIVARHVESREALSEEIKPAVRICV